MVLLFSKDYPCVSDPAEVKSLEGFMFECTYVKVKVKVTFLYELYGTIYSVLCLSPESALYNNTYQTIMEHVTSANIEYGQYLAFSCSGYVL